MSGSTGEIRDGMRIDWDVPIPMDDGIVLRADVFRPTGDTRVPVVMNMGPYGKGVRFQDHHFAPLWHELIERHPEILAESSGEYLTWEAVDPEIWVPAGYAVVRVDSRGAGSSPGVLDVFSARETEDLAACIEWAGTRSWSTGRVGLCGISYYAINQWTVAARRPRHLAAIIPWEGAADHYRDMTYHGGILSNAFYEAWFDRQVGTVQHGLGANGPREAWNGRPATGAETLTPTQLAANRVDYPAELRKHPFDDEWHRARSAELERITVPLLTAANWGGHGLHSRGSFEAFARCGSADKWLEVHPGSHEEWFYLPSSVDLQRRFFDRFLKQEDNGWDDEPRVRLRVRRPDGTTILRLEHEWPLERTAWTRLYLQPDATLATAEPPPGGSAFSFDAHGMPVTFTMEALGEETEITGPLVARLQVSTTSTDADLFVTVRALAPDGTEVTAWGAGGRQMPLAYGWLRLSHRGTDPARSLPYRPWHLHDEPAPVEPGVVYTVDVEIWPTSMVLPPGHRLAMTVGGTDFSHVGEPTRPIFGGRVSNFFLHDDPDDRPAETFSGTTVVRSAAGRESYLLVPVVPRHHDQEV
jgi:hypothetical protein